MFSYSKSKSMKNLHRIAANANIINFRNVSFFSKLKRGNHLGSFNVSILSVIYNKVIFAVDNIEKT